MTERPIIVKVGGSLFDLPDLGPRLAAWLAALPGGGVVFVPGGGAAADLVRTMDRIHGLDEERSHWLALRTLSLTAHLLADLLAPFFPVVVLDKPHPDLSAEPEHLFPILDLFAFARTDEGRPGRLPHRWDVTSDSLAARLAVVLKAPELILLKSVTLPPGMDWAQASRQGIVDGYFPTVVGQGVKARVVNLREWQP